jgi:hypothetical protein
MAEDGNDLKPRETEDPERQLQELGEQLDDAWYGPPLRVEFVESPDNARTIQSRVVRREVCILGPYHFVEISDGSIFLSGAKRRVMNSSTWPSWSTITGSLTTGWNSSSGNKG